MEELKIVELIIKSIINYIIPLLLGYFICGIKNYRKRDASQEEALKCLLRSTITSKYFVYTELGKIPQYEKENLNYMNEQYKIMGGNSYIKQIMTEINELPIEYVHHDNKRIDK